MARVYLTLAAGMCLTVSLGSIHAFSVFIQPLESEMAASRGALSLVYALALVSLTAAVYLGHRLFSRMQPAPLVLAITALAALGLWISSTATNLLMLYIGYSLLFGFANGLGYGYSLQLVAQATDKHQGLFMGAVTAVYAVGAMVFASLFAQWITADGAGAALWRMAVIMSVVGVIASGLLLACKSDYRQESLADSTKDDRELNQFIGLTRVGYGLGAFAGLMVIGHATGLVEISGGTLRQQVTGVILVGLGNACGGVIAGALSDRLASRSLLMGLPLFSLFALLLLLATPSAHLSLAALTVVGFAYGAIIAAYPAVIRRRVGDEHAARVYGRVFIAWGIAGLAAPWAAGALFDAFQHYQWALIVAVAAAAGSMFAAMKCSNIELSFKPPD